MNYYLTRLGVCTGNITASLLFRTLSKCRLTIVFCCLIIASTSCSVDSPRTAESLSLTAYDLSDSLKKALPETWPENWQIEQIDDEPFLYKIKVTDPDDKFNPAYALLLKECGVGKNASATATTRQLLVGLKDIKILRSENFNYNDERIFYKESTAGLDGHDIMLSSFTLRREKCVFDTVIWSDDLQSGSIMDWFKKSDVSNLSKIYFAFSHK